jgi:hypothetical protein
VGKYPSTDYEIGRWMKLEQKQLTWLKGAKIRFAAWSPKVHLIRSGSRKEVEPIHVGDGDEDVDH